MDVANPVDLVPYDYAALVATDRLKEALRKRRQWWTAGLQGYTDPAYLRKAIAELRAINTRLDALGARSRPLRGLAVVGEVS